jgi:hypothetical protein
MNARQTMPVGLPGIFVSSTMTTADGLNFKAAQ